MREPALHPAPQVAVLTTGDELHEPDEPLRPNGVRNSNTHSVPALVTALPGEVAEVEMVPDDAAATRAGIDGALAADVLVLSGGVSVGERATVRAALAELGVDEEWGVALRPGKPTSFGVHGSGALVFGLPGNPVSAMVTFLLLARPAIEAMLGLKADRHATAILDEEYPKRPEGARGSLPARAPRRRLARAVDRRPGVPRPDLDAGADALALIPSDSGTVTAGEPGRDRVPSLAWPR